ncbi:TDT family transporter [Gordonia sp. NPDC003585]|uniref:TDT family transporter n=1 Tax=Gordonia sp. NPDC003585 TaxID=3154275 RepID=UPI0033AA3D4C
MATLTDTRNTARSEANSQIRSGATLLAHVTPNWFGAVMGTGIVATAAAGLPVGTAALEPFAVAMWLVAAGLLVVVASAFVGHWMHHPENARGYARHPMMGHFYGAPAMALLTVGAATLLVGRDVVGDHPAVWIDAVLWTVGTLLGVATSVCLPYSMMTRRSDEPRVAMPCWLMSVVPPMVSATTGALLVGHIPAGQARLTMLCGCYGLFGLSLFLGMITMTLIYSRAIQDGPPAGAAAPTFWITLGLIGQSVTAANLLGNASQGVFTDEQAYIAQGLRVFGIGYGMAMAGFGVAMFALAVAVTVRAVRRRMPFAITWWSFTFPVGTCVTGLAALGKVLHAAPIEALSVVLFVALVGAWTLVASMTVVHRRAVLAP